MSLTLHVPDSHDLKPRLTVFGVGGAGGNAVNNMIARSLEGVEFVVANTDAQALSISDATDKIQLGEELTEGLGAGAKPEVGARAAEESIEKITDFLMGSHMCFITAGMGGGTGTGAAPVIAQAARQMGILTVGVVTKPFHFEGARRMTQADGGIFELQKYVDTLIVIPNQNLFRIASEKTTFAEAFGLADDVLYQGVKGVTDLMVRPGMVNLDFADIRSVMDEMGKAMMGTGEAEGEDRALLAAENAIANPLLDEISLKGARGVLINITGGDDLTLHEVDEASNKIRSEVDPEANIIFGTAFDPELNGRIRVSVVATGIDSEQFERDHSHMNTRETVRTSQSSDAHASDDHDDHDDSANDLFSSRDAHEVAQVEASSELEDTRVAREAGADGVDEFDENRYDDRSQRVEADEREDHDQMTYSQEVAQNYEPSYAGSQSAPSDEVQTDMFAGEAEPSEFDDNIAARQRVQQAANAVPVSAPAMTEAVAPPSRSRFGIDSMIRKMSGQDEVEGGAPVAAQHQAPAQSAEVNHLQPRRSEPQSRMDEGDRQRVDIPAFLRRKAN